MSNEFQIEDLRTESFRKRSNAKKETNPSLKKALQKYEKQNSIRGHHVEDDFEELNAVPEFGDVRRKRSSSVGGSQYFKNDELGDDSLKSLEKNNKDDLLIRKSSRMNSFMAMIKEEDNESYQPREEEMAFGDMTPG